MIYELLKDRIMNGGSGGEAIIESLSITANGTYRATGSVDGYSPITVAVPQEEPDLEDITITNNGTYTHAGKDGYDEVIVNVPQDADLTDITITENGTYQHPNYDGYDNVVVSVPEPTGNINITDMNSTDVSNYATAQVVDADLVASNIKKDVNVLGVVGTYEPPAADIRNLSVTANGTYTASGFDGYSPVVVNVPQEEPDLEDITITENGTYTHAGKDGYDTVVVNVSGGGSDIWQGLIDRSIKGDITIPSGITKLGNYAFAKCAQNGSENQMTVTIPESVTEIGDYCFYDCTYLTSVTFPSTLQTISQHAFDKATFVTFPEGIPDNCLIYSYCFSGCQRIKSLRVINNNQEYGNSTFRDMIGLESITLNNVYTQIPQYMFYNTKLSTFTIPARVTRIDNYAFSNCSSLTSIYFEGTPTTMTGTSTFSQCPNLTDIYVPWAEGAIAKAPWGATNATIHYNYTPA